jgi:hypothetical protein
MSLNQNQLQTLTALLGRAYTLAVAASMGDPIDQADAEEVAGETAEFLAHLEGGATMDEDAVDPDLRKLAQALKGE